MRTSIGVSRHVTHTAVRLGLAIVTTLSIGCSGEQAVLTQQFEADHLGGQLHVEFARGNEATNRAVLADTDEASSAAAQEAKAAMTAAADSFARLAPLLSSLGYASEKQMATDFGTRFAELQTLDAEILPLAVENTNLKAQRLSFGAAQDAVDAATTALRSAYGPPESGESDVLVERVIGALREIQVLEARHLAESDEATMTKLEGQMHEEEGVALRGLTRLRQTSGAAHAPAGRADKSAAPLEQAEQAVERLLGVNQQIVDLSRRNTNVRSLALTLGRRRVVAAECEDLLRALQTALSKRQFSATR
jgi:hypothetical protein